MATSIYPSGTRACVQKSSISANGARDAEESFNRVYGNKLLLSGFEKTGRASLRFSGALFDDVLLGQFSLTSSILQRRGIKDEVTIISHVKGDGTVSIDSSHYDLRDSGAVLLRPNIRTSAVCLNGSANSLVIPGAIVRDHAQKLICDLIPDHLFDEIKATPSKESRLFRELRKQMNSALSSVFGANSIGSGELASAGNRELLLSFAAACIFPVVGRQFGEESPDCGPYIVRRARDYIKAHASEPLSLAELANDLGVSMRSLQLRFKKCFGLSPRDYLMDCRLDIAHDALSTEGLCASVTHAAMAAGFSDLSYFAVKYRERFGQTPLEALRGAHRHES